MSLLKLKVMLLAILTKRSLIRIYYGHLLNELSKKISKLINLVSQTERALRRWEYKIQLQINSSPIDHTFATILMQIETTWFQRKKVWLQWRVRKKYRILPKYPLRLGNVKAERWRFKTLQILCPSLFSHPIRKHMIIIRKIIYK